MPIPQWRAQEFGQYYNGPDRDPSSPTYGQVIGYGRQWARQAQAPDTDGIEHFEGRWARLVAAFGITRAQRVLVVGCGFGFLVEAALGDGYRAWGLDSSAHIDAQRGDVGAGVVVMAADLRTVTRAMLDTETGGQDFAWIVTEDVLPCYTDADSLAMVAPLEGLLNNRAPVSNVVHLVRDGAPNIRYPDMTWHTLAEWSALMSTHSVQSISTGEVGS